MNTCILQYIFNTCNLQYILEEYHDGLMKMGMKIRKKTTFIREFKYLNIQGMRYLKPRSHALIYTRYANYTYMYNLHPGVKNYLLRVHMFLKSFGPNRA